MSTNVASFGVVNLFEKEIIYCDTLLRGDIHTYDYLNWSTSYNMYETVLLTTLLLSFKIKIWAKVIYTLILCYIIWPTNVLSSHKYDRIWWFCFQNQTETDIQLDSGARVHYFSE